MFSSPEEAVGAVRHAMDLYEKHFAPHALAEGRLRRRRHRMTELASKTCVPCRGGVPPLRGAELEELSRQVPGWEVVDEHHLRKEFRFKNFREALDFVNRVGELAEEQAHHPDIDLGWGRVGVTIFTHKIDGLTESDFILAAKIDKL